jgi:uncharacterized protein (DUF433 family)
MSANFPWEPARSEQKTQQRAEDDLFRRLLQAGKTTTVTVTTLDPQFYWSQSNFGFLWRKLHASSDAIREAVTIDTLVMHGNPIFAGTRIPIYEIVEELADGTTLPEILEGYPSLRLDQIEHALDFAASLLRIYDDQIPD